jgi:ERCC4-related helicase
MISNFKPRLYQETILAAAVRKNILVVLPTGLGKTAIALLLAKQRMIQYPNSKILVLAPTKPLAEQHLKTMRQYIDLPENTFSLFTGNVGPTKRAQLWSQSRIVVGTPQGVENDLLGMKIDMSSVSLLVLDEAHHATGDYSYCFIAKHYMEKARFPRILGLTASPGSNAESIMDVCKNIYAEGVEVRTFKDSDVAPYVQEIDTQWIHVDLIPPMKIIQQFLSDCYRSKLDAIKKLGYLKTTRISKGELLQLQAKLHSEVAHGVRDGALLRSLSLFAEAMKVQHALELIETQSVSALWKYMGKMEAEARQSKSKAVKNLVEDNYFKVAFVKTKKLMDECVDHPKLTKLLSLIKDECGKVIIFSQYRDSAAEIHKRLAAMGMKSKMFVGQSKRGESGLSQKEQINILQEFRDEKFNILVSTSVGEEGLDIPSVDLVIFYEPIPSAIRHIQRRGRTGRQDKGRIVILVTNDTRDAAYRWVAHRKEQQMHRTLDKIKTEFVLEKRKLKEYGNVGPILQVVVDYREKGSEVMKALVEFGVSLRLEKLHSADYLCSAQCAIEFKTVEDFVNSIIDGRLVEQLRALKKNFAKPLVIVQGEQDMYAVRKVHPNSIRGMLATIAVGFGIPVLQTKNAKETAALIMVITKREQDTGRDFSLHSRKPLTLAEQQEYLVSALPGVGLKMAKLLLHKFGSVQKLVMASVGDLKEVEGVGDVLAPRMKDVLEKEYKKL